jgi:hypothetical protein
MNEIAIELHALVRERLFGPGPWLADIVANAAICRKLQDDWKLWLNCISPDRCLKNTPLGDELHVELMSVFAGHWEPGEIPEILRSHRLISEPEMRDVYDRWENGENLEDLLLPLARRAYLTFMQAPELFWQPLFDEERAKQLRDQFREYLRADSAQ